MSLPSYPLAGRRVIKVYDVIDIGNTARVEGDLFPLIRDCSAQGVVIDLHAPLLTSTGIDLLLAARDLAIRHGLAWSVVARRPAPHRVTAITGTTYALGLCADLKEALRIATPPSGR
ncbi:hypothetical protein [Streptomyces sp. N35]|uniref:hypothetical protein n=1 Tax=Streptomyces sp. N35 TaxID=2795730 RepID=UPI0018F77C26|nr:hypothetical protein [Streptomyces sp. N35]